MAAPALLAAARARARLVPAVAVTLALLGVVSVADAAPSSVAGSRCVAPPVAHRGDSARAPENTLAAYRAALRVGVTRWELDVRFTADDVPILMHDTTVDRTTNGTGAVPELTSAQISELDAGSWFSSRYAGTRVPTLYQLLEYGSTRGATYLIELKTRPTPRQMQSFLNRFRWLGLLEQVRVTSFDEQTIRDVRLAQPGLRTGMSDYPNDRTTGSVLQFGRVYMAHHRSVTAARMAALTRAGITVQPWPADTRRAWTRMARHRSGPVITNRPHSYLVWARGFCSRSA